MNSAELVTILIKQFNKNRWWKVIAIAHITFVTVIGWSVSYDWFYVYRKPFTIPPHPKTPLTYPERRCPESGLYQRLLWDRFLYPAHHRIHLGYCEPTILYRDFTVHKLYCAAKGEICPNSNILFTWILFLSGSSFHLSNLDDNTRGKSHKSEDKRIIKRTVP